MFGGVGGVRGYNISGRDRILCKAASAKEKRKEEDKSIVGTHFFLLCV